MPSYATIANSEIDPESPITTGLMTKLRDNLLAVITADATAPSISMAAFDPGGSQLDGAIAGDLADPGLYDSTGVTIAAAHAWSFATIVRVHGNVTISDILTIAAQDGTSDLYQAMALMGVAAQKGENYGGVSGAYPDGAGGGGGVHGDGGRGNNNSGAAALKGVGMLAGSSSRAWPFRRPLLGAIGGSDVSVSKGGGSVIFLVDGNFNATGGTIKANGSNGGGGGSIIVMCTGQISGGTYEAKGANGGGGGRGRGGGGGGYVALIATSYGNARTKTVTAGAGDSNCGNGVAGFSSETTLTRAQILSLCNIL